MNNKCMERKGKHEKIRLKLGIVVVVLVLAVMAGLGTFAYAAPGSTAEDEMGVFNPFTLSVMQVSSGSGSTAVVESVARPPIRIPVRPVLRSFFRPPLVTQAP